MLYVLRDMIWSFPLLLFLLGFGVYLLFKLRHYPILNVRWIYEVTIRKMFNKEGKQSLKMFSVALGGTMGIGNIVGASSCVLLFGAGSLFWMWVSALLGMVIKYAEIVIAMHFRKDGVGGPMLNFKYGLHLPILGGLYAVLCFITSLGIGNLVPMNALISMVDIRFDGVSVVFILLLAFGIGWILFYGKDMIEKVCLYMVPFMTIVFVLSCFFIVCMHIREVYSVLCLVFSDVFSFKAFGGGVFWSQLQMGLARGIYSNEAGMGTSSIVHVKTMNDGCQQGAWGILEVFLDTVVSCTLSALVVLLLKDQVIMVDVYHAMYDCFQFSFGIVGDFVYFTSMVFFAMAGMLAWCYYAQECLRFLRISDFWYPFFFVGLLLVGSFIDTESIWAFTDICNGCMLLLNVSSMVSLSDVVIFLTNKYFISKGYHVK